MIKRQTSLSSNIVTFCRHLRNKGFGIGPQEEADALQAIEILEPYADQDNFRLALRSVLTKKLKDQILFDELYESYWRELDRALDSKAKEVEEEKPQPGPDQNRPPSIQSIKNWLYANKSEETTEMASYSATEMLASKNFSAFNEDGMREVVHLIHIIAQSLANKHNRRYRKSRDGRFDLRRTLRLNLRRGGEIVDLGFKKQQNRQLQLVLLCDVSKSMDLYSQFLVQFIYAFQNAYRHIETFVFSTSLQRVTHQLQYKSFGKAMQELSESVFNWSGGTKIGASLKSFWEEYSSKMLNNRTVVLIMSDGWDTGDVEILEEYMYKIHRKAGKVIWLNPLAGNPNFEPTVQGMAAAMPYIDVFAPGHNVESLRAVVSKLKK